LRVVYFSLLFTCFFFELRKEKLKFLIDENCV